MLFSVNIAGIPMGIITSIIYTHYLGPNGCGDYQFLDNLFNFTVLVSTFGFFQAANRALVLNHDKEKARQYYGASFIILLGMFVIMSVGLVAYSFFDPNFKEKHLSDILFYSIPYWMGIFIDKLLRSVIPGRQQDEFAGSFQEYFPK